MGDPEPAGGLNPTGDLTDQQPCADPTPLVTGGARRSPPQRPRNLL